MRNARAGVQPMTSHLQTKANVAISGARFSNTSELNASKHQQINSLEKPVITSEKFLFLYYNKNLFYDVVRIRLPSKH